MILLFLFQELPLGALHSMNLFLKRPDLINGVIAMSGVYDLTEYTKGYYDERCLF